MRQFFGAALAAMAIVTGTAVPAAAGETVVCDVSGSLTVDPVAGAGAVTALRLSFEGTPSGCEGGTATALTVAGSVSCATDAGSGAVTVLLADASVSATAVLVASGRDVAVLGLVQTGDAAGQAVSATLTAAADVASRCADGASASLPAGGSVAVHPSPLVLAADTDGFLGTPSRDPWSLKDEQRDTVDAKIERCPIPGDMYRSENSICKYSQAWVGTKCTRVRNSVTGGSRAETVCTQKQMVQFAYRGGTSNLESPMLSGHCANASGVSTDTERWHLYQFRLVRSVTGAQRYEAAASHYAFHVNCDTEGQRFYGTPQPVTMDDDHVAQFRWVHFDCGRWTQCQVGSDRGFESSVTFGIGVPA
ncbi:MAG TPA: hypothetical protein VFQ85_07715 [Mycobacteriales bacterium]|jgi:hypothetical protein|nr:hypothetical protein [Mycobacteriales bacterium]